MCMSVCLYVCKCPQSPEESVRSPRTKVTNGYVSQCGCWKPNSSPLHKQQVLITAEKSLQPNFIILANFLFAYYNDYKLTLSTVSSNSQE